ncbi:hypothetical protein LZ30DRAFT_96890 [Colletotrichum cereale]|nr:hypothetical protein LZ30DRAFT_96890 [Colletotrichum cereale]
MESALPLFGSNNEAMPGPSCRLVVADRATERHTKKTVGSKRQRTFTGCWTCRQRHVKCDELRPSCRRCNAGKFTCQGYDTRFTWLAPNNQAELKSGGRSQLRAKPMTLSAISRQPPNREIPSIIGNQARGSFTAFRAFEPQPMRKPRRLADQRGRATTAEEQTPEDAQLIGSSGLKTLQTTSINTSQSDADWFGEVQADMLIALNRDDAVSSVEHAQDLNVWAFDIGSNCSPEEDRHPLNRKTLCQHKPNGGIDSFDSFNGLSIPLLGGQMTPPCEALPASTRERELINHWATNLANKLIPIRSPVNPFLTIVSPMALEGSRMARTKSTCTVALFHAVCAISAAHQANEPKRPPTRGWTGPSP